MSSADVVQDDEIPFAVVERLCRAQGIEAMAVISAPEELDGADVAQMLSDGVGDMDWLMRQQELRKHPRRLLPGATRLLCTALPYHAQRTPAEPAPQDEGLRRARYAAGADYHHLYRRKLAAIGAGLDAQGRPGWSHRALVDSAPLNERQLARRAGLGWIGRNALLISPETGSYRFLGYLLTSAPLAERLAGLGEDRCGRCTACETRCPTRALTGRRVLSERCISYLTIEHQGVIGKQLAAVFGGWWYGCDLCQEACPWNRMAPAAGDARLRGDEPTTTQLLAVRAADFDQVFAGRAIRRIGYARYRRNLLVALFSLGRLDEARQVLLASPELALVQAQGLELGVAAVG